MITNWDAFLAGIGIGILIISVVWTIAIRESYTPSEKAMMTSQIETKLLPEMKKRDVSFKEAKSLINIDAPAYMSAVEHLEKGTPLHLD